MTGGAVLLRKMSLAQTAGTWWRVIYMCSCSCFLTDKKALSHLWFRWGTRAALQRRWPLGHVSYHIRNICHFANESSIKVHQICGFRMRQRSARKPEKQPPPANAGIVCPIFTSWDESKNWEGEGGEKERDLGSVMIINYPFSRSQLCLRTRLLVRVWWFVLQNDYHIINRPGWILAFVVQRTLENTGGLG